MYFSERYGFYALSRFADVLAAHRDWQGFSSAHGIELFTFSMDPEEIASFRSIIMMDPPEHDRFRALVSRVFTPRAVTALEPMIREVICGFLDPFDDAPAVRRGRRLRRAVPGRGDLAHARRARGRAPADPSTGSTPASTASRARSRRAPRTSRPSSKPAVYFHELTVEKRKNPGDDMLSRLTQVTVDRGDGVETGLDDAEITGFVTLLGGAGAETVTKLVGNAVVLFWQHPDQWQKVVDDHEKIPRAVEEILRYLPPSQYQGRFCVEEREFEGGTIPAGFPVLLITGAATRDPRAFERADEFDIERQPGITIGFGHGVHSCLGAALARMESRIAIEELATRWQRLEVDEAGPAPRPHGQRRRLRQRARPRGPLTAPPASKMTTQRRRR